jgi:thiol-disulfide isomerase/thioredoxin
MSNPTPAKGDRVWIYVGLTFAALWGLFLIFFNPNEDFPAPLLAAPELPLPVDFSWKLEDMEGNPVTLGDFKGKPIFINIWATWCGPCREEMPSIVKLAARPNLKGVVFLGVTGERANVNVQKFAMMNMQGIKAVRTEAIPESFGVDGIPATFIISPDGKMVMREVGAANWNHDSAVAYLEAQLKIKPAETPATAAPAPTSSPVPAATSSPAPAVK